MSHIERAQPVLQSGTRRFGRYESFYRFDNLSSGHASVGSKSVGKMTVDCQFLFKKSRWGVLGDKKFPAGIIYLDLNFGPPQGSRVKNATITVTLDDKDECLDFYKDCPGRTHHQTDCPVQMTDYYGPKQLAGEKRSMESKRIVRMTPEVNVFGTGGGGLGVDLEKSFTCSSRWAFNGQLLPSKDGPWGAYKTLRWDLSENELDEQALRSSRFHTAFTFEHSGRPFLMKVEIEGRLERKWTDVTNRARDKWKFGSSKRKDDSYTTTLIDFKQVEQFPDRLDELARSLPRAMELENFEEIPVEIPDRVPASFQPVVMETGKPANALISDQQENGLQLQILKEFLHSIPLEAAKMPPRLHGQGQLAVLDGARPSLETLKRAAHNLLHPDEAVVVHESEESCVNSSDTEVVTEEEELVHESSVKTKSASEVELEVSNMEQEMMLKILQIPALLFILQLILRLIPAIGTPSEKEKTKKKTAVM